MTNSSQAHETNPLRDDLLYAILDHAHDLIFIHPLQTETEPGHFLACSQSVVDLLGYSHAELKQLSPRELIVEAERTDIAAEAAQLSGTGKLSFEKSLVARDGTIIPVEIRTRLFDYDGKPTAISIARDISHQIQLVRIAATVPYMVYAFDLVQGKNIYINQYTEQFFGLTLKQMQNGGQAFLQERMHPEDRHKIDEFNLQWSDAADEQIFEHEYRLRSADGTYRWIYSRETVLHRDAGGRVTQILGTAVDVTAQKQTEVQLRNSTAELRRFYHAVEQSPVAVLITDASGTIEYVNARFTQVTGYSKDEAIGQNPRILKSGRHEREFYADLWQTIINGQEWLGEMQNRKKDGTLFWERAIISPVVAGGEITHFVALKEDITEQKSVEEQMRQQDRLAAVGQLAAGIAHDFNNIMAVIMLYAQLSQQEFRPYQINLNLETIIQQTRRATSLIQQILDFSRQSVLERKPLHLLPLLKELIKLLERTLPDNIRISLSRNRKDYVVNGDPTRLQQMLMNLSVNARDAMPDGGLLLFEIDEILLDAHMTQPAPDMLPGRWIKIRVSDTGSGIPNEIKAHLFEPFFTTKEQGKGTGLGLAQVYGIVKQHAGHVVVTSEVGKGTTFEIFLPALPTGQSDDRLETAVSLRYGNGETVLIVEDNEATRQALVDSIDMLNYTPLPTRNGHEAITFLTQNHHDVRLILSDMVMPIMGGEELLQAVKEHGLEIPIVLLSGHLIRIDVEELRRKGMAAWLSKPPDLAELAQTIAAHVAPA